MATTILGKYIGFNDTGTGTSDVWSASKIISYVGSYNPFDQSLNTTDDVKFNDLNITGNIEIPTTTSTTGQIKQNGNTIFHTYGTYNLFLGTNAGSYTTTGHANMAIGYRSQENITTGTYNVSIGHAALMSVDSGSRNVVIGNSSGENMITGYHNTFVGTETGWNNFHGVGNVFLGYRSGYYETGSNKLYIANSDTADPLIYGEFDNNLLKINGDLNVTNNIEIPATTSTVGQIKQNGSTIFHTYGQGNLFLGPSAGNYSTTGYSNTAIGRFSQRYITTGFDNVSVGSMALGSINVGKSNTAVGTSSGGELTAGYNNTFVGYETAGSNVDGIGNVFLGYRSGYGETGSNKLYIANSGTTTPLIYGEFDNNLLKINGTFNVTGATDLDSTLNVDGAVGLNSTLNVTGDTTVKKLTVGGAADLDSTLNVDGDTTVQKLTVGGYLTPNSRVMGKLSTIGNSSSPTLGSGNYFVHTYTSLIRINASGWTAGSVIVLGFSGNCNVYSSYSASGTNQGIRLQGTVTFTAKAGDTLTLINDGTYWRETSRMVS